MRKKPEEPETQPIDPKEKERLLNILMSAQPEHLTPQEYAEQLVKERDARNKEASRQGTFEDPTSERVLLRRLADLIVSYYRIQAEEKQADRQNPESPTP